MLFIIRRYLYFLLEHENLGDNYKLRMIFPLHFTSCIWQWLNVTQCPQLGDNYMYNKLLRLCVSQAELFLIFMNSLHNYYIIILFKLYGSIISSSKLHYPFRNVYTYQKKTFSLNNYKMATKFENISLIDCQYQMPPLLLFYQDDELSFINFINHF